MKFNKKSPGQATSLGLIITLLMTTVQYQLIGSYRLFYALSILKPPNTMGK